MTNNDTVDHDQTDSIDQPKGINRRRMFVAGAGIACAAALAKVGTAEAADGGNAVIGTVNQGDTVTTFENTTVTAPIAGPANAVKGVINSATNGSHAVLGTTAGDGHAVAGVNSKIDNGRAATWGRHLGLGAGAEGENKTPVAALAGAAVGVLGSVTSPTNGSHAVKGITNGAGHSVAGDTPATVPDAPDSATMVPNTNTTAATWGRHGGVGAGIGGISAAGYGGEFLGGKSSVRLIPSTGVAVGAPTDAAHLVGELFVDGAGDLYYNPTSGANFTKLNGQGGIVILSDPGRAFDSREEYATPPNTNKGRFAPEETRVVDLSEFTSIPASAKGAVINITVTETGNPGFVTVFNGDTADSARPISSSVNWVRPGDTIANGITVPVGTGGKVKVYSLQATEIIIDVVGYIS